MLKRLVIASKNISCNTLSFIIISGTNIYIATKTDPVARLAVNVAIVN